MTGTSPRSLVVASSANSLLGSSMPWHDDRMRVIAVKVCHKRISYEILGAILRQLQLPGNHSETVGIRHGHAMPT